MKEYFDEEEYLEDIYGDEIKVGDIYYEDDNANLIHEKNLVFYLLDNNDLRKKGKI